MTGLLGAVVCEIVDAAAVVLVVAISGNCWRKLARKSSPGFCELRRCLNIVSQRCLAV